MTFTVKKLTPEQWSQLDENAHLAVFGEFRDSGFDRVDFALLLVDEQSFPTAYISCVEWDKETVYWKFGGASPTHKGSIYSFGGYLKFIAWCSEYYKRITTRIENGNKVMLKMALEAGFLIRGTYTYNDKVYVELCLDMKGA